MLKPRILLLVIFAGLFNFSTTSVAQVWRPDHNDFSRLWIVEVNGRTSYMLGTDHSVRSEEGDYPSEVLSYIKRSRKIILEQDDVTTSENEKEFGLLDAPKAFSSVPLNKIISREGGQALRQIYKNCITCRFQSMRFSI